MNGKLAATRTNFLKVKKNLLVTREGHELLDEKRRILLNELSGLASIVARAEEALDQALEQAYAAVDRATVAMGQPALEQLSFAVDVKTDLSLSQRRLMGVSTPVVRMEMVDHPPYFSPHQVSLYVDEAIVRFKEILKMLSALAEKKIALLRLAHEASRTIRKVRAMEKIQLPELEKTLKFIGERLDEESREAFSILKLLKERERRR
ncbi:MAG TPA: V-type ATP synthase subunit D [bacterium]|nr:V-type ATP synthase subunit D [bacterium]